MSKPFRKRVERDMLGLVSYVSPRANTRLLFLKKFGRFPNLKDPQTLNEILLKEKLAYFGTDPEIRRCADKYTVRDYVRSRGCGDTLNELIAVYDSVTDIDWDALPQQFVMKWNFGCGYNIVCADKSRLSKRAALRQMRRWGREPFWCYYSELQYRGVPKKILVEKFLGTPDGKPPEDYKFYCFHGQAYCVMVCRGREAGWPKFYFFDRSFRLMRINRDSKEAPAGFTLPKPAGFEQAVQIADRLSDGFPFVRVDLYLTEGRVYFGELTFTPAAALDNNRLPETDRLFGSLLQNKPGKEPT